MGVFWSSNIFQSPSGIPYSKIEKVTPVHKTLISVELVNKERERR